MINKALVKKHFGQHVNEYDQYAKVQKLMALELLQKLPLQAKVLKILELGSGTGYLTERLLTMFPQAELTAVDLAPEMLAMIEQCVGRGRVDLVCDDLETMQLDQKYDLIISSATFQWLNEPALVMKKFIQALSPQGILAVATFGVETFTELHQAYQKAGLKLGYSKLQPPGQKFFSLTEWRSVLEQVSAGQPAKLQFFESFCNEYFSQTRDFLQAVKKIGASNSNLVRNPHNPSLMREMMRIYDTEFRVNDQIQVTYQLLFLLLEMGQLTPTYRSGSLK